jgi:hypothetical protein
MKKQPNGERWADGPKLGDAYAAEQLKITTDLIAAVNNAIEAEWSLADRPWKGRLHEAFEALAARALQLEQLRPGAFLADAAKVDASALRASKDEEDDELLGIEDEEGAAVDEYIDRPDDVQSRIEFVARLMVENRWNRRAARALTTQWELGHQTVRAYATEASRWIRRTIDPELVRSALGFHLTMAMRAAREPKDVAAVANAHAPLVGASAATKIQVTLDTPELLAVIDGIAGTVCESCRVEVVQVLQRLQAGDLGDEDDEDEVEG